MKHKSGCPSGDFGPCDCAAPVPAQEVQPVAWRYQRKEGWGDIWRYFSRPITDEDFETPGDWVVQPLYATPPAPAAEVVEALRTLLERVTDMDGRSVRVAPDSEMVWLDTTWSAVTKARAALAACANSPAANGDPELMIVGDSDSAGIIPYSAKEALAQIERLRGELSHALSAVEGLKAALREVGLAADGPLTYSRSYLADKVAGIAKEALSSTERT